MNRLYLFLFAYLFKPLPCVYACSRGRDVHLSIQRSGQRNPDHHGLQAVLHQCGEGNPDLMHPPIRALSLPLGVRANLSLSCTQECPFILDVNLGVISRLETISVSNQGENTKGLELVCKVTHTQRSTKMLRLL